jgi:hypothetical protein
MATDSDLYVTDPDFQRTIPYFNILLFIIFDRAACFACGNNVNDGRRTVPYFIRCRWQQIKATPLGVVVCSTRRTARIYKQPINAADTDERMKGK